MKEFLKHVKQKIPDNLYEKVVALGTDKKALEYLVLHLLQPHIQHFTDDEYKLLIEMFVQYKAQRITINAWFKLKWKQLFNKLKTTK